MNTKTALHNSQSPGSSPTNFSLFESITLLNECRDVAADWLAQSLDSMLGQLEGILFEQADQTFDRTQANILLESRAMVQQRRLEIEKQFRANFVNTFNTRINARPQEASAFGKIAVGELELSLVANDDFEEKMVVDDIAKRFKQTSVSELNALDQRIGMLMQRQVDERDNPLSPGAIAEAFKKACEDLDLSNDIKRVMLEQFDNRFVAQVPQFYQTINQHLVTRNVMPVISVLPRRASAAQAKRTAEASNAQANASTPVGMTDVAQAMEQGDWQQVLGQLMSRPGMSGGMAMPMGGGMPQSVSAPVGLLNELSRMQQHQMGMMSAAGANILHDLRAGALSQVAPEKESITIDIVAMLFDYIFDDHSIPSSIKALIGRLQIPVLKVAILDNKFFSKKSHPARKLLDTLASASIGLADEDAHCQRLKEKAAEIIHHVLANFEDNLEIFTEAQAKLEAFLAHEDIQASEEAAKTAKSIYDRERLELARVMAVDELRQRAVEPHVPDVIREFFTNCWSEVAARSFIQSGEQGQLWLEVIRTAEDLVWSVAPKTSVEERMKLVSLLPDLLRRLEKGVTAVKTPQDQKEVFFSALVQCHAQAIKAGIKIANEQAAASKEAALRTAAPVNKVETKQAAVVSAPVAVPIPPAAAKPIEIAVPTISPMRAQLKALESQSFDPLAGSLAAATSSADQAQSAEAKNEVSSTANNQAGILKRGCLVEFGAGSAAPTVMKLAWVSPLQGVYLFTNRDGKNAVSIDKLDLEKKIKAGEARLLDNTALFDRAMTTMVSQLQGASV